MKNKVTELLIHVFCLASVIAGLVLIFSTGFLKSLWFFTIQTNIFIGIIETILVINSILKLKNKELKFVSSKPFSIIRLMCTFFITITGTIYCFVLTPVSLSMGDNLSAVFNVTNILLHIVVPVLAVLDYLFYCKKGVAKFKHALLFLIYPFLFYISINIRALLGGSNLTYNSPYPYFFMDPTFNNQGWGIIVIYACIFPLLFYGLACLFIAIDKKINKKQITKN